MISIRNFGVASLFLSCVFSFGSSAALAQDSDGPTIQGKVGVLEFKMVPPLSGAWRANAEVTDSIARIMRREGIALPPQFAFENPRTGAIVWGTFSPFPEDFTVDAYQQSLEEPFFPKTWGIRPEQITKGVSLKRDYSWLKVSGQGDGKTFSSDIKSVKTQGIFSIFPVQYDTGVTVKSGAIFIDYRGPDFGNSNTGEQLVKALIESLKPSTGITLLSNAAFKAKYAQLFPSSNPTEISERIDSRVTSDQITTDAASVRELVNGFNALTNAASKANHIFKPRSMPITSSVEMKAECPEIPQFSCTILSKLKECVDSFTDLFNLYNRCRAAEHQLSDFLGKKR